MKLSTVALFAIPGLVTLFCLSMVVAQEDPTMLFEQARMLDENNTNLGQAIALYSQVAGVDGQRALSAEAQLRVGLLYERLGRDTDAQHAYETVVRDYPDQPAVANHAQERIAAHAVSLGELPGVVMRQVWAGEGVDILGAPSADGRHLSFVDWSTGDLAVRDLETEQNRRLTDKGPWMNNLEYAEYSTISPDGRLVAYSWFNPRTGLHDLRLVSIDGSHQRVLYQNEDDHYVQPEGWSPDGSQILALVTTHDGTNQIVLIAVEDGSKRVLKSLDWRLPWRLSISPDGDSVVFDLMGDDGNPERDIYLLPVDGGEAIPLVEHPSDDRLPIWSVDGSTVFFISDRTGAADFWGIDVSRADNGGYPKLIRRNIGDRVMPLGFTSDGSLYYGMLTGMSDVYVASIDVIRGQLLSEPVKVARQFEGSNSSPEWSPDGAHLAMVRSASPLPIGEGPASIVITSSDGQRERVVDPGLNRLGYYSAVRWSPDGKSFIAVSEDSQNRPGLYRIDAETADVTTITHTDPESHIAGATWFPDGNSVLFAASDYVNNKHSIVKYNLRTEVGAIIYETKSPSGFIRSISLSPDGGDVAFVEEDHEDGSRDLRVISIETESVTNLATPDDELISHSTGLTWTPDGANVLFGTYAEAGKMALWKSPVDGGPAKRAGLTMNGLKNVRFHPDGKRIAFVAGSYSAEVWAMSNFIAGGIDAADQ